MLLIKSCTQLYLRTHWWGKIHYWRQLFLRSLRQHKGTNKSPPYSCEWGWHYSHLGGIIQLFWPFHSFFSGRSLQTQGTTPGSGSANLAWNLYHEEEGKDILPELHFSFSVCHSFFLFFLLFLVQLSAARALSKFPFPGGSGSPPQINVPLQIYTVYINTSINIQIHILLRGDRVHLTKKEENFLKLL